MEEHQKSVIGKAFSSLRRKHERVCHVCGKQWIANNTAKYCSDACRMKAHRLRKLIVREAL